MKLFRHPRWDRRHVGKPLAWILVAQGTLLCAVWAGALVEIGTARAAWSRAALETDVQLPRAPGITGVTVRSFLLTVIILGLGGVATTYVVRRHASVMDLITDHLGGAIDDSISQRLATRHALILGLAKLADCRDAVTGAHLERICAYSVVLAEALQREHDEIDDVWIENLRVAASLHDIGKVGIPDAVLLKEGALSTRERAEIERHPVLGADTLIAIRQRLGDDPLLEMSVQICLMHHEKWDGSGYPYSISGEEIPLAARIVALADVYDALTTARSYRQPMAHEKVCDVIADGRGNHFDPGVVDAFLRVADQFDMIRQMYADQTAPTKAAA